MDQASEGDRAGWTADPDPPVSRAAQAFVEGYERHHAQVAAWFGRRIGCPRTVARLIASTFGQLWDERWPAAAAPAAGGAAAAPLRVARRTLARWRRDGDGAWLDEHLVPGLPPVVADDLHRLLRLVDQLDAPGSTAAAPGQASLN